MKTLIIQPAFIGDVILATALVEELAAQNPAEEIHFLLRKGNETLLSNNPHIKKVWVLNKKESKFKSFPKMVKSLRKENFEEVIVVQRFFSAGFLAVFSGGKKIIGFDKNPFSFLFHKRIKHEISTSGTLHEVDRNRLLIAHRINLLAKIGLKLYPSDADFNAITIPRPFITMSPASVWFTKQLPQSKWIELMNLIPENMSIVVLGGKNDYNFCHEIIQKSRRKNGIYNQAGAYSFLQSAAAMKLAKMNFVNDSAPLHIASAMNANVTAFFCSTVPEFGFGPLSQNSKILQEEQGLSCRPCGLHGKKSCPESHFKCGNIDLGKIDLDFN